MDLDKILDRNFYSISDKYREFAKAKDACRACSIWEHYKHVGMSEGNADNPTFMFIGEALGADEVLQKRPFVGKAGQRLRVELRKHSKTFDKTNSLITNVLACRPLNNKFPNLYDKFVINENNKRKSVQGREVVNHCAKKWLIKEILLVQPKIIITLGAKALEFVRSESGITANRGSWKFLDQYKVWSMATFHPSYVIRCQNSDKDYVAEQFEQDIEKVVKTWRTIINADHRMSMSQSEWERERALSYAMSMFQ